MWWTKCFTRGLREFERRINVARKDKATGQECTTIGLQNKFIPCLRSSHVFDNGSDDLGVQCKSGPYNDKKRQNRDHQGEKWRENVYIEQFKFFGALGGSGMVGLLCWYICQPICRHRHPKPLELNCFKNRANINRCHKDYINLNWLWLVSRTAAAQPLKRSIFANERNAGDHAQSKPAENSLLFDPFVSLSVNESDGSTDSLSETSFGPLTGEQAVNEAAAELKKTNKSVSSEIEHLIGMACMQLGKHKEAMTHFQKAVELDYAPAAFNLGICYETGVGTVQDLKLAAKYYELASEWGHATAMYNLGVFHVRGWGGVQIDCDKARELFVAAAELGESNAKKALAMVSPREEKTGNTVENEETKTMKRPVAETRQENVKYKSTKMQDSVRSPQRKLDPTEAFYQVLGIKSSDAIEEGFNINNSVIHNKDIGLAQVPIVC